MKHLKRLGNGMLELIISLVIIYAVVLIVVLVIDYPKLVFIPIALAVAYVLGMIRDNR